MSKRILALCLALLTLFPLFASCGKKTESATVTEEYLIVYAANPDPYTAAAVSYLRSAFAEAGIKLSRITDDHAAEGKEIRVGVTNRETAPEAEAGKLLVRVSDGNVSFFAADGVTLYRNIETALALWLSDANAVATAGEVRIDGEMTKKLNAVTCSGDTLRVLSQNLRSGEDGNGNDIDDRAPRFRKLVNEYKPDLVGMQESTDKWKRYLKQYLSDTYTLLDCADGGAILVKNSRFEILDSGVSWLSDTPEVSSRIEGSLYVRAVGWVTLRDKTTDTAVLFCNTHLDNSKDPAVREKQAQFVCRFIESKRGDATVYVTGDFNALPHSEPYEAMIAARYTNAKEAAVVNSSKVSHTYHNYGKAATEIDFCFFDDTRAEALSFEVLSKSYDGYVSDHYGILSVFCDRG